MSRFLHLLLLLPLVACSPQNDSDANKVFSEAYIQSESGIIGSPDVLSAQVVGDSSLTLTVKSTSAELKTSLVSLQDGSQGLSVLTPSCDNYNKARSCSVKIKFTSAGKVNGVYQDSVIIEDLIVPIQVTLAKPGNDESGIQISIGSEINLPSVNFGTLLPSQTISKVLIIKDINKKSTQTASLSVSTTNFQLLTSTCSSVSLNSSAGCSVRVLFSSTGKQPNTYNDILKVGSREFSLTALIPATPVITGSPDIKFLNSSDALITGQNFGDVNPTTKSSFMVKIKNQGTATTALSSLTLSGTGSGAFYLSGSNCSAVLPVNASCSVVVNIAPASLRGEQSASLNYAGFSLPLSLNILGDVVLPVKYTLTLNAALPSGILSSAGELVVQGQAQSISNHSYEVSAGETIDLSFLAHADQGLVFGGWNGACAGTGNCSILMDSNKTVSLNLSKTQHTLTMIQPYMYPLNSLNSAKTTYEYGETASISLSYDVGYFNLGSWAGACSSASGNSCQVLMDGDKTVSVNLIDRVQPIIALNSINDGLPALAESILTVTGSVENVAVGTELSVYLDGILYVFAQAPKVQSGNTFSFEILAPLMVGSHNLTVSLIDNGAQGTASQSFETKLQESLSLDNLVTDNGFIYSRPLQESGSTVKISGTTENVQSGSTVYIRVHGTMAPEVVGNYQAYVENDGTYSLDISGNDFVSALLGRGTLQLVVRASLNSSMQDSQNQVFYYRETPILDGGFVFNLANEFIEEVFTPTLSENIKVKLTPYFMPLMGSETISLNVRILTPQGVEVKKYENAISARNQEEQSFQIPFADLLEIPAGEYRVVVEHPASMGSTGGRVLFVRSMLPEFNSLTSTMEIDPLSTVLKIDNTPLSFTLDGEINKGNRLVSVVLVNGSQIFDLGSVLTQAGDEGLPDTFVANLSSTIFNSLTSDPISIQVTDKVSQHSQTFDITSSICAAHDPDNVTSTLKICNWVPENSAIGWKMQGGTVAGKNPTPGASSKWMAASIAYVSNSNGGFDSTVVSWSNASVLVSKTTNLGINTYTVKPSYLMTNGIITTLNEQVTGEDKIAQTLANQGINLGLDSRLSSYYSCGLQLIQGFRFALPNALELSKIAKKVYPSTSTNFLAYSSTELQGMGLADSKVATDLHLGSVLPASVTSIRPEANELVVAVRADGTMVRALKGNQLCTPLFVGQTLVTCNVLQQGTRNMVPYCYRNF